MRSPRFGLAQIDGLVLRRQESPPRARFSDDKLVCASNHVIVDQITGIILDLDDEARERVCSLPNGYECDRPHRQ